MQANACTAVATASTETDKLYQKSALRGMAMIMV
jgi:hypothetical protein